MCVALLLILLTEEIHSKVSALGKGKKGKKNIFFVCFIFLYHSAWVWKIIFVGDRVDFTKLCLRCKKSPIHRGWRKIRHSILPTFYLKLRWWNLPNMWGEICQFNALFAETVCRNCLLFAKCHSPNKASYIVRAKKPLIFVEQTQQN